jgi:hypothetical protein
MARMILALAVCGAALVAIPAAAQDENAQGGNTQAIPEAAAPALPLAPPAPNDTTTGSIPPASTEIPPVESKAPENPAVDSAPQSGAAVESRPVENIEGRYTFNRINDGYVRLDNRTGQVSFCSKRTVGWTCQLAPEDRGVLENEISRLQEENVALKKELLARGLALPGSAKSEPPVARNERPFSLPSDPNIERMKGMVEKAWRRLVDMISMLQKDVLKKS